jgi:hypothetical protein
MPNAERTYNLADWRIKLQRIDPLFGGHTFARVLKENTDPYAVASALKLPVPAYVKPPSIATFLKNSDIEFNPLVKLGISNFYVGLRSPDKSLDKFRTEAPLAKEDVVPYILERISPDNYEKYTLRVAEYVVAECGMVIVVNPSGTLHIDMVMGDLGPLATGAINPQYKARTDRFSRVLRYTKVDLDPAGTENMTSEHDRGSQLPNDHRIINEELRAAIDRGVSKIPKVDESVSGIATRLPGRYELAFVNHNGLLVPIYVDAQPDEAGKHPYAIPEEPLY